MKLSKRMEMLAGMVTSGNRLADVGTDHGYIPIRLCLDGEIPGAIAMDINRGPLERAAEHIKTFGLEDRIETRLSDGLEKLYAGEADTILIAGMGGLLVQRILQEGQHALPGIRELILQPQSDIPGTRKYLREHGFRIADENMLCEDGKYYPMMRVVPADQAAGQETNAFSQLQQDSFGPILLVRHHPVLWEWMERERKITERILTQLHSQTQQADIRERIKELEAKHQLLAETLAGRYYETTQNEV